MTTSNRRRFLEKSVAGTAGAFLAPAILPRTWLFAPGVPPSRRIQVALVGCGRMGTSDLLGTIEHPLCRAVALCDLDSRRLANAKAIVEKHYASLGQPADGLSTYRDYRELLARKDVDAVIVSPPDHWHGLVAIDAVLAGKDVYVQKPLTYDIAEALALRKAVRARRRVLQTGSQQRSENPWMTFRIASEAARNGRIGKLTTVRIGIGQDRPSGRPPAPEPVPANLDYETWLGPAPQQPYMERRVHPQHDLGRPGWITTEDFGLGMITNWGAHHIDIAQWGMGMELSGPTTIDARAEFMRNDVWTVHHTYHVEMQYPNGVTVILDDKLPNGVRFEGSDGWVFCARGATRVTASDGNAADPANAPALLASDPRILDAAPGASDKRWMPSSNHYLDWLEAIVSRRDPIANVDEAARSLTACAAAWIGMKLGRRVVWDPVKEAFANDAEANALCARKPRSAAYDITRVMKEAGLS